MWCYLFPANRKTRSHPEQGGRLKKSEYFSVLPKFDLLHVVYLIYEKFDIFQEHIYQYSPLRFKCVAKVIEILGYSSPLLLHVENNWLDMLCTHCVCSSERNIEWESDTAFPQELKILYPGSMPSSAASPLFPTLACVWVPTLYSCVASSSGTTVWARWVWEIAQIKHTASWSS